MKFSEILLHQTQMQRSLELTSPELPLTAIT